MKHTWRHGYVFLQKNLLFVLVVIQCKPSAHLDAPSPSPAFRRASSQNHLGFVLSRVMGMMNKDGRSIVSGVLLDPSIYPPGESTLPDPIFHWYGYSASHKWLFGTITLFVFRPLPMEIKSMVS